MQNGDLYRHQLARSMISPMKVIQGSFGQPNIGAVIL